MSRAGYRPSCDFSKRMAGEAGGRSSAEADIERQQAPERTDAHDPSGRADEIPNSDVWRSCPPAEITPRRAPAARGSPFGSRPRPISSTARHFRVSRYAMTF
jgi:hypothetical protein